MKSQGTMAVDIAALQAQESEIREVQISAMFRRGRKALDCLTGLSPEDPPWLHRLAILGKEKALEDPDVKEALLYEIQHSDPARVFRVLKQRPPTDEDFQKQILRRESLLLTSWLARDGARFEFSLCYYTDTALAKLLWAILRLRKSQISDDWHTEAKAVRKWWERLGLKKGELLFKDVSVRGDRLVPVPFDKLRQR